MKTAILAALALFAGAALAQDVERGRLLYETHCSGCHYPRLHDRANSSVQSEDDLRRQVERWTRQAGRPFSEAERDDLVAYLNATHYRLKAGDGPGVSPAK